MCKLKKLRAMKIIKNYLAGNQIRQAIETVQPFGIDLCSSVRTSGKLDQQKLKDFFKAIEN